MKKVVLKYGICAVLTVAIIMYFQFSVGKTVLMILPLAASMLVWFFLERKKTAGSEASQSEKPASQKKRSHQLDVLRIIATLLVIALHAFQAGCADRTTFGDLEQIFIQTILLSCNFLFIMLAGSLAFKSKSTSIPRYYCDRAIRILVPMFFYYLWNYFWYIQLSELTPGFLRKICADLYSGQIELAPQFWLLYPILVIYLAAPFLRYMFGAMPYRAMCGMTAVGIIVILIITNRYTQMEQYFPFWIVVALIGFWAVQPETRKYDLLLIILGAAAFVCMIIKKSPTVDQGYGFVLLISIGLFSAVYLLFSKAKKIRPVLGSVLEFLSRYSFGILLIHWWVLYIITRGTLNIYGDSFHGMGTVIAIIVTFAISIPFAYLFDNTVVYAVSAVLGKLVDLLGRLITKAFGKTSAD